MYDPEILKGLQMAQSMLLKHEQKLDSFKLTYKPIKNECGELVQIVPELEVFLKG